MIHFSTNLGRNAMMGSEEKNMINTTMDIDQIKNRLLLKTLTTSC